MHARDTEGSWYHNLPRLTRLPVIWTLAQDISCCMPESVKSLRTILTLTVSFTVRRSAQMFTPPLLMRSLCTR